MQSVILIPYSSTELKAQGFLKLSLNNFEQTIPAFVKHERFIYLCSELTQRQRVMCKITNLREDPFTRFSAEEDILIINDIFYRPSFYPNMLSLLEGGVSRSILGQRGQGKSVVVHKLCADLVNRNCLPLLVDRYDGIPPSGNKQFFMYKIVQMLTLQLARKFVEGTLSIHEIPEDLRNKFYALVEMFYDTKWAPQFMESRDIIKRKKAKNCAAKFFNRSLITLLNNFLSGAISIAANTFRQVVAPDAMSIDMRAVQYTILPNMTVEEFHTFSLQDADKITPDECEHRKYSEGCGVAHIHQVRVGIVC